jgi:GNAT superfamily N-acetyltransferase
MGEVKLRLLHPEDLPDLMALTTAAGWNQTPEDWQRLLHLEPSGAFGIEMEGRIVASATVLKYGRELAWIGMVLTLPAFRGRGFARSLMERALAYAAPCCVRLDASDMGKSLYRSLGFADEYLVERWQREAQTGPSLPDWAAAAPPDYSLDRDIYGCDRRRLLERLAEDSIFDPGGFALGRRGARTFHFGPCLARDCWTAARLAQHFVGRHSNEPMNWDLCPGVPGVVDLARSLGFGRARTLTRMVRGGDPQRTPDSRLIALAGFEYG